MGRATSFDRSWRIQSSARVHADGRALSMPGVDVSDWYPARLPATVLGTLVDCDVYGDPFTGLSFLEIPGQGPAHENFSLHAMPEDSPFRVPWWFRTEFELAAGGTETWLECLGINYRANIWLNGHLVADSRRVAGAYRTYEWRVSEAVRASGPNALAIEVFPPTPEDLAITWVDWNPSPPDKNMGLWQGVTLRRTGPIALRDPQLVVDLSPDFRTARLAIYTTLVNGSDAPQRGVIEAALDEHSLQAGFELDAGERREIAFAPIRLDAPRLWWPRRMGEQPLYALSLSAQVDGRESDRADVQVGIRRVTSELTDQGHALFRVNGRRVLIRGGGWAKDLFQRENAERDLRAYEYVKDLGLNAIRFEGMLERRAFLERCDRDGILVIAGWCCCDRWEQWQDWTPENHEIAVESLRSQTRRVRHHPSLIAWWYGSDNPPPADVERRYLDVLREERWPNPAHSSASQKPAELTGPSGMKMLGPYDYVPPSYWLSDTTRGGAFGFATEIGPGPAIPPMESLRAMLGDEHLWPIDDCWSLHCGGGVFKDLTIFNEALAARYGPWRDVDEYAAKAQLATYEAQRAMFEAYSRNRYVATGVIQWMLNNAWPSLIWHLWDWCLRPGGGYFGTKKACEPLHVQYSYDDRSVVVVNDTPHDVDGLRVEARLVNLDLTELFREVVSCTAPADSATRVLTLPEPQELAVTDFLRLTLGDETGAVLSRNDYWLSTRRDEVDDARGTWYYTPMVAHADMTGLNDLPPVTIDATLRRLQAPAQTAPSPKPQAAGQLSVTLHNPSNTLAFFLRLQLMSSDGSREILPVLWDDNYVSLLPGERLTLGARLLAGVDAGERPVLRVSGWNVPPVLSGADG